MRGCGLALAGLLLLPLTATAHHSVAANFDARIVTELEGEITRVFWRNPHVRFTIRVEDERGQEVLWDIETTSVPRLRVCGVRAVYALRSLTPPARYMESTFLSSAVEAPMQGIHKRPAPVAMVIEFIADRM